MTRREMMMKSIEDKRAKQATQPPKPNPVPPPAKSAGKQKGKDKKTKKPVPAQVGPREPKPGEKPTKSQRTAKARDARMVKRGRLPNGTCFKNLVWDDVNWSGEMYYPSGFVLNGQEMFDSISHKAPGLFQLLEELDTMYRAKVAPVTGPKCLGLSAPASPEAPSPSPRPAASPS